MISCLCAFIGFIYKLFCFAKQYVYENTKSVLDAFVIEWEVSFHEEGGIGGFETKRGGVSIAGDADASEENAARSCADSG
jgi:hypothetical protein